MTRHSDNCHGDNLAASMAGGGGGGVHLHAAPAHLQGLHAGRLAVLDRGLAPLAHSSVHVAGADVAQRGSVRHV